VNAGEVCVDVDLIEWALGRIGDEITGCPFEPMGPHDEDHHGRAFAQALFEALKVEVAETDALRQIAAKRTEGR
jgi:hypothetical protein